jgi:hypothetical protein
MPGHAPLTPRLLTRQQAAGYCGLTESGFSSWIARRLVPGPLPGTKRWDRKALDLALDRLSGILPEAATPACDDAEDGLPALRRRYQEWKVRRAISWRSRLPGPESP